uniref:Uncharacterized protein n=1 Tax=Oryza glumipatula TaxID=40148 RepID=A0A0E0AN48_9ORYZ
MAPRVMGVLFSCPVDDETAAVEDAAPVAEQAVLKASLGSGGRLRIEGSLSFKTREQQSLQVETKIPAVTSPRAAPAPMPRELLRTRFADAAAAAAPESPKHEAAAVTLQKVYKSFRTRRRLADCAVLMSPTEEDEEFWSRVRSIPSDRCADAADNTEEEMNSSEQTRAIDAERGIPLASAAGSADQVN